MSAALPTNMSYSKAKALLDSPAALWAYMTEKREDPTPAQLWGSLVDCLHYTPERFEERYLVWAGTNRTTKEGKAAYTQALEEALQGTPDGASRQLVTAADYNAATAAVEALQSNEVLQKMGLLKWDAAQADVHGEIHGIPFHGVIDQFGTLSNGDAYVADLKTVSDGSPAAVKRAMWQFRYHLQASIYLELLPDARHYFIIAVTADGDAVPYRMSEATIQEGRELLWKVCDAFGTLDWLKDWHTVGRNFWAPNGQYFEI